MKTLSINCPGYDIAADWYEGSNDSSEVILILIGYTSKKASYRDLVGAIVNKTGMSALVIDYSGHGDSPFDLDDLTPAQNFLEVITAFDWLKENHSDKSINVMGTSYGGFLATQLTNYRTFDKLVLRVPAIYPPNNFYTKWRDIPDKHFAKYRAFASDENNIINHPLLARVSRFTGKSLVVIHELDEFCPEISTRAFADAFKADVWVAEGLKHGLGEASSDQIAEYQQKIADWLK